MIIIKRLKGLRRMARGQLKREKDKQRVHSEMEERDRERGRGISKWIR